MFRYKNIFCLFLMFFSQVVFTGRNYCLVLRGLASFNFTFLIKGRDLWWLVNWCFLLLFTAVFWHTSETRTGWWQFYGFSLDFPQLSPAIPAKLRLVNKIQVFLAWLLFGVWASHPIQSHFCLFALEHILVSHSPKSYLKLNSYWKLYNFYKTLG